MDFVLCEVIFYKEDAYHRQYALASVVLIPPHASRAQHVQINEYLLIKNYMAIKSLH